MGTIGLIGSVLTLLAGLQTEGPLKGVAKIVGTAGLKLILPRILQAGSKLLTKIPFIGSLISIGYAYSRFQSGDYIGAGIDVLSGIASLFPGPGTIIALGLDALNAFLDISGGGSSKEASVKKEKAASGWVGKIIKWGAVLLKKIPFVGTIINLASAFGRFKNGQIPQGILELGSAVAMLFPGIGTAISFGIDALTTMLDAREEGQSTPAGVKQEKAASGWVGKVIKWATFALKKIPFVGTIINLGSAYLRFKNKQFGRGILELISAVANLFPGIGTAVSFGIDALTTILDAGDGEEGQTKTQEAPQKSSGGIWETFKKWGWYAFTKLPIIGFISGIGKAWNRIKQGQVLKGALELLSGIATTFPGLGTVISIGIDGLLAFLDSKEEPQGKQGATQQPTENPFETIQKAIVDKAKKWWKGTWDWVKWLARKILPDNIIKFLDDNKPVKEDIAGTTEPQRKAEQPTANSKETTKSDFVSQRIKSISENLPKERGTSYLTGNVEAHDYLEQLKNLTPTEQRRINAAARLNPEAGHAVASKIIANKQKAPTAKQIDSEDQASKEQGINPSEELSENKFKYLKGLNFFQRALAFTMQPNLKAQYEKTLSLEQKETNPNILEANRPAIPTSGLPSTNKEVSQEPQADSPIKKLPQWNQQAIKETSPEAEKALAPAQPPTTQSIDKQIDQLRENVNRQMEISNVGTELSTAFEEGGFDSLNKIKDSLREKLKVIFKIEKDDELDTKLDQLNNNVDNFKLLKKNQTPGQTLNDIKVHQTKKQREKAYEAAGVDSSNPPEQFSGIAPPTSQSVESGAIKPSTEEKREIVPAKPNSEKIKAFQELISQDNVTEAQDLINQTAKEKDFVTAKSMIDEWKSIISDRETSDVKSGTLQNFTKNIIQSNGPLADSNAVVEDAVYDSTIKPQLEENKKKLDEAMSKLKSPNSDSPISSAPQNSNSLTEVNQTSNIDSSLLQAIANNTGNSNQNLTMFANGLNQIAKALERVGEAVGEKIKIPPVVVNNSAKNEQKKVSSTEVAKQGNPAIAQFRGAMENLRPIPA